MVSLKEMFGGKKGNAQTAAKKIAAEIQSLSKKCRIDHQLNAFTMAGLLMEKSANVSTYHGVAEGIMMMEKQIREYDTGLADKFVRIADRLKVL